MSTYMPDIREILAANSVRDALTANEALHFRVTAEAAIGDDKWKLIHDFFKGWGWLKHTADGEHLTIFLHDVHTFMPERLATLTPRNRAPISDYDPAVLDQLWLDLKPHLEAYAIAMAEHFRKHPPKFDRIFVPRFSAMPVDNPPPVFEDKFPPPPPADRCAWVDRSAQKHEGPEITKITHDETKDLP